MNKVILIGRLTKDPEVRYTGDNMAVASFAVAIDRQSKEKKTDFPRVTVFGKQAENCERFLKKGRLVGIEGSITTGSYDDKDGKKVYTTDVSASRVEFLEWEDREGKNAGRDLGESAEFSGGDRDYPSGFQEIDDSDIPF